MIYNTIINSSINLFRDYDELGNGDDESVSIQKFGEYDTSTTNSIVVEPDKTGMGNLLGHTYSDAIFAANINNLGKSNGITEFTEFTHDFTTPISSNEGDPIPRSVTIRDKYKLYRASGRPEVIVPHENSDGTFDHIGKVIIGKPQLALPGKSEDDMEDEINITSNGTYTLIDVPDDVNSDIDKVTIIPVADVTAESISAGNFTVNVPTGSTINNQNKLVNVTSNGTSTVTPDSGYTGLGNVTINTDVAAPDPVLQNRTVNINSNTTTTISKTDNSADGLGTVTVVTNIPSDINNQTKSETIKTNGTITISPDSGYSGLSSVKVTTNVPTGSTINNQNKSVNVTSNGTSSVTPDSGYTGLGKVTINTNIPSDINNQTKSETITTNGTITINPDSGYSGLSSVSITTDVVGDGRLILMAGSVASQFFRYNYFSSLNSTSVTGVDIDNSEFKDISPGSHNITYGLTFIFVGYYSDRHLLRIGFLNNNGTSNARINLDNSYEWKHIQLAAGRWVADVGVGYNDSGTRRYLCVSGRNTQTADIMTNHGFIYSDYYVSRNPFV